MADIVNQAQTRVMVDGQQAANELTALEKKAQGFKDAMVAANKGGDVKGYEKAKKGLQSIDKEMKNIVRSSFDVNKVLSNLSAAGPKQLKAAFMALNGELNSGKVARGSKEWDQLQRKIRLVRQELDKISSENKITKSGNIISGVQVMLGNLYTKALSLLGSAAYDAVNKIRSFEKANVVLAGVLGENRENIKDLTASAIELGKSSQYTASQVTELQTELAKLGFSKQEIKESQKYILQFATALGADLGSAATLAGASLRAFNADTEETQRYVSAMTIAANASALGFEDLATAMPIVAPVAKAFNFSIEDTLALLGNLSDSGFDASSAATSLRNILLNLADSNGKLAKALGQPVTNLDDLVKGFKSLESKGIDLATALELTDKRSVAAFQTFLQGADKLVPLRDSLIGVGDQLEKLADDQMNNLDGSVKSLQSSWEALMLSFSNSAGPMKTVVDWITKIVDGWTNVIDQMNKLQDRTAYKSFLGITKDEATIEFELKLRSGVEGQTYDILKGDAKEDFESTVKYNFRKEQYNLQKELEEYEKQQKEAQKKYNDIIENNKTDLGGVGQFIPLYNMGMAGNESEAEKQLNSITTKADAAKARLEALSDAYGQIIKTDKSSPTNSNNNSGGGSKDKNKDAATKQRETINNTLIEIETKHQKDLAQIKQSYLDGDILTEEKYKETLLQQQDEYDKERKNKLVELLKSVTDPSLQINIVKQIAEIDAKALDRQIADRDKQQKKLQDKYQQEQDLLKWNKEETLKIVEDSLKYISGIEDKEYLDLLEKRSKNLISEAEYQREFNYIRKKYLEERLRIEGMTEEQIADIRKQIAEDDIEMQKSNAAKRKDLFGDNEILQLLERMEQIDDALMSGAISFSEAVSLRVQAYMDVIQGLVGSVSNYMQAANDAETAAITKKYDKQIKAAGNNSKQVKKLEDQRDKELAEVNRAAQEKSFKIQVAQALASTAQSAINAYNAALQTGPTGLILAPIAAATAVAAGMLQVATIKKQHEAAMANYWSGGYTGSGGKYDVAGYVHRGEFVVTQETLANPEARQFVDIIDIAQRNNTVSSLKTSDFTTAMEYKERVAFNPSTGSMASEQERQQQSDALIAVLNNVADSLTLIDDRFSKPLYARNYVKGKYGMEEALNLAERMDKNVKR
ncbi:phage tail tape measure protein [Dysgonomonas sp. 521]|uniref:phage tail tape measure protein n=1 Tax=Dysgonomonas sp. 521 TaxID=2302932 RepID=UPI0013CFEE47|nr:phage tail tape measure protein [Dysgonomonas sp. 521]NDV97058.1 phage tail tape measure protein [Dysgonomonas sp. 521]